MKYPLEAQSDLKDCGVSCLSMLIRYYGGSVSKEYLRFLTNTNKDGVSAYSLIEAAKQLGFSACGVSGRIVALQKNNLPCIAHVVMKKSYQHFIVIYQIYPDKKKLLIADPSQKKLEKISFDKFNEISTNKFILLIPNKKIKYLSKNTILKKLILKFINQNQKKLLFIFLFSLILTILNVLCSFQFQMLLEFVINYQTLHNLMFLLLLFTLIILLKEFVNYYRNYLLNIMNLKLDKTLFSNIYHHILSLPYLYYKNRTTGEVISRMNDLESIREVISKLFVTVLLDMLLMISSFIVLWILSPKLTMILLVIILLLFVIVYIFQQPLEDRIMSSKIASSHLNSFLVETIGGIESIQNCNIKNYIEDNFRLKYGKYHQHVDSYHRLFFLEQYLKNLIQEIGTFFILIFGCFLVIKSGMVISSLITYMTLVNYFLNPIENIIELHILWKQAKTSLSRINELYEVEEIHDQESSRKRFKENFNRLTINHLKYSYNGKDFLLKDINIEINPSDKVLIHGESGSGKSTLSKIISKQLEMDGKSILYNDKNINCYQLTDIHKNVCYVSQQETLFTDSVYQNVVLDQNLSYDEFLKIAKICMLDEIVENNFLNYDMLLEENGFNLSGGQRQRIILARALVRNANIYILDEALNQVDIQKERKIFESLFKNYPNKIFVVISHRFHNQDLFNKKYHIKDGVSYEE